MGMTRSRLRRGGGKKPGHVSYGGGAFSQEFFLTPRSCRNSQSGLPQCCCGHCLSAIRSVSSGVLHSSKKS